MKKFKSLILCVCLVVLQVIAILILNKYIVPQTKALDNYQFIKSMVTIVNNLIGISMLIETAYFLIEFSKQIETKEKRN